MRSILSVITAADSYDLTVLDRVKAELKITGTQSDAIIGTWITEASGMIADYCNRVFALEEVSETIWPDRRRFNEIMLKRRPVTEIVSITEGQTQTQGETVLTVDTDYQLDPELGILYRVWNYRRSAWCTDKLVIQYKAGYELLNGLPRAVERACVALVKSAYFARTRDPTVKSEDVYDVGRTDYWVGGIPGSTSSAAALPPDVQDMLDPHKEEAFGA